MFIKLYMYNNVGEVGTPHLVNVDQIQYVNMKQNGIVIADCFHYLENGEMDYLLSAMADAAKIYEPRLIADPTASGQMAKEHFLAAPPEEAPKPKRGRKPKAKEQGE